MWDRLVRGALGAVVLVDTRRLEDSFTAIDFFDNRQIPYVVVVNKFDGILHHSIESVRKAMVLDAAIPIVGCDARNRAEVQQTLLTMLEYVISLSEDLDVEPSTV
jgi:signal recognition particle receptor subunit beta